MSCPVSFSWARGPCGSLWRRPVLNNHGKEGLQDAARRTRRLPADPKIKMVNVSDIPRPQTRILGHLWSGPGRPPAGAKLGKGLSAPLDDLSGQEHDALVRLRAAFGSAGDLPFAEVRPLSGVLKAALRAVCRSFKGRAPRLAGLKTARPQIVALGAWAKLSVLGRARMEVTLLGSEHLPEGCLLSIRSGGMGCGRAERARLHPTSSCAGFQVQALLPQGRQAWRGRKGTVRGRRWSVARWMPCYRWALMCTLAPPFIVFHAC